MSDEEATDKERTDAALAVDVREMPISLKTLDILSQGPTVPKRYQGKPYDMMAAVLSGRELGIEPMEAINSLYLVDGNVSMTGKLMSALVHRAGHQLRAKLGKDKVTVVAWRRDPFSHELINVGEVTFSKEDAERAGLAEKQTYLAYPSTMMTWRALSQVCRFYFADVLSGIAHVPEEVGIEAPLEIIDLDEDLAEVEVDGVDLDTENAVADVVNILDADVEA
jgi:hypothetical protein